MNQKSDSVSIDTVDGIEQLQTSKYLFGGRYVALFGNDFPDCEHFKGAASNDCDTIGSAAKAHAANRSFITKSTTYPVSGIVVQAVQPWAAILDQHTGKLDIHPRKLARQLNIAAMRALILEELEA